MQRRRRASVIGVALAFAIAAVPASASAAVITVNSGGDALPSLTECSGVAGDCSLRQAIDKAQSGADTIQIPKTVPTITLANGALTIAKDITIDGAGAAENKLDGHLASGLFGVDPGESLSISGLTLTRGSDEFGAALSMNGAEVTLTDDNLTDNLAGGADKGGFGVIDDAGSGSTSLTITGSSFTSNHVGGGGTGGTGFGVIDVDTSAANAALTITNTTFSNNSVGGGGGDGYGTVDAEEAGAGSKLTISGSTFSGNHIGAGGGASGFGGAVDAEFTSSATVSITNSRFTSNTAGGDGGSANDSGSGFGGGISANLAPGGTFTLLNSTFSGNRAGGNGSAGNNSGSGYGGGLDLEIGAGVTAAIADDTFSGQRAGGDGGTGGNSGSAIGAGIAIVAADSTDHATITNTTISGNSGGGSAGTGNNSGSGFGGGISVDTGPVALVNDTIDGNTLGARGAGAGINGSTMVTLKNTILSANTANGAGSNCGGAITSQGHNLIDPKPSQCGSSGPGDITGNPNLGALANNGGATLTQALHGGPAINAATNVGCPATDQRGVKRPQGAFCDIGAYESAPPTALTGAANHTKPTSAALQGTATNPDVVGGSAHFQFGKTKSYGSSTGHQPVAAGAAAKVIALAASKLKPGTRYHYRLVVTNPDGTSTGADRTFKTPAAPPKLSQLKLTPSKFAAGPGTKISYRDSAAGTTTFTVRRKQADGSYKKLGSFKHKSKAGANHLRYRGKLGGHDLQPGKYRLQAVATSSGKTGKAVKAGFQIT